MKTCSITDCDRILYARSWCSRHYDMWRKHGSPEGGPGRGSRRGPLGSNWRGENISYAGLHFRIKAEKGRASEYKCFQCSGRAGHWAYQGGDTEEITALDHGVERAISLDSNFYKPMCAKCHKTFDLTRSIA